MVKLPAGTGNWREGWIGPAKELMGLPEGLTPHQAAMVSINPPTAYQMLKEFVPLRSGDWIIQNAANSAVGRLVIQMAKVWGIRTINVVRRSELKSELEALGADVVCVEGDFLPKTAEAVTNGQEIRLALNAVGGESAQNLAKVLAKNGILVTYGGMSKQPFRVSTGALIFKNISIRGFWITDWLRTAKREGVDLMFQEITAMFKKGLLQIPVVKTYRIEEAREALEHAMEGGRNGKILFEFNESYRRH
jgi:NADPH:quinone reductase-like Zn-dependent oxidoreductase